MCAIDSSHPHPPLLSSPETILRHARELAKQIDSGAQVPLLKGRNLAMVSTDEDTAGNAFCAAARGLGAHISIISPSLTEHSDPIDVHYTAKVLGRLYSALEWPGIPPLLLEQFEREAAILVFDGISSHRHPLTQLAVQLDINTSIDMKRCLVIQAVLVNAIC